MVLGKAFLSDSNELFHRSLFEKGIQYGLNRPFLSLVFWIRRGGDKKKENYPGSRLPRLATSYYIFITALYNLSFFVLWSETDFRNENDAFKYLYDEIYLYTLL